MFLRNFFSVLFLTATCRAFPTKSDFSEEQLNEGLITDRYLVKMTSGTAREVFQTSLSSIRNIMSNGDKVRQEFHFGDFRGFSMDASPKTLGLIRGMAGVELVESDRVVNLPDHTSEGSETLYDKKYFTPNVTVRDTMFVQQNAPYNLDRLSHRENSVDANRPNLEYLYRDPAGRGTTIYVIDSGVYINHDDFGGRAYKGYNFAPGSSNFIDDGGHGTHVASTAAGSIYGVAKNAIIYDVKIFNHVGQTTYEAEVSAISWSVNHATQNNAKSTSVLNMSFGGPADSEGQILNQAVIEATNQGLFCAIAAGNNAQNAEYFVPANTNQGCIVGNTDKVDRQNIQSNYGPVVDIWAPGTNIVAAGIEGPTSTSIKSGTSMACPAVAGVAAYFKSFGGVYSAKNPIQLCYFMASEIGTRGHITYRDFAQPPGHNLLLYNLYE